MSFTYRLQKILELREQALEKIQIEFEQKNLEIKKQQELLKKNKDEEYKLKEELSSNFSNISSPKEYFYRIQYLGKQQITIQEFITTLEEELREIRNNMLIAQRKTEILYKHKDKQQKEFELGLLKDEEKLMNEIALIMRQINS